MHFESPIVKIKILGSLALLKNNLDTIIRYTIREKEQLNLYINRFYLSWENFLLMIGVVIFFFDIYIPQRMDFALSIVFKYELTF